ncbi:MAG: YdcF family protein [Oscillospiraceae bacterium]|nr:YdcF family protein [Oscillospiraceae bacterium]
MNKIFKTVLGTCAAVLAAPAVLYFPAVIYNATKKYDDDCEYLMILGSVILGEDTPSDQLIERMNRAVVYLKSHLSTKAVCCGGCFRKEQKVSEAQIIKNYLMNNGIEEERILLEDKSTTTYENFEFALKIIAEDSTKSTENTKIAYLTSDYHIFRSGIIAKQSGIKDVLRVSAKSEGKNFKRYLREYFVGYDLAYRTLFK